MTQNNLGVTYFYRISGDKPENLELAIAAFEQALQVHTPEALPSFWARTHNNLGVIYVRRISGDKAENLDKAIAAFEKALQIYSPETLPILWAETQMNLGTAYHSRVSGSDRTENSEKAIKAYEQALTVFTPEADPIKCLEIFQNLGNLHFTQGDWEKAIDAYENAITAAELSRSRATTDENRQKIMEKAIAVYQKQVQAHINIQQWDKAIETIERSKARNLVELLTNRDFYPKDNVPQEMVAELDRLRRSIPSLERQLQVIMDQLSGSIEKQQPQRLPLEKSRQRLKEELQESRQQLNEVLNQIKPFDPSFNLTQKIETIRFQEIQSLVDEQTAMIQWYFTGDGLLTSIITQHGSPVIFASSSAKDREVFFDWVEKYLGSYSQQREQWKNELPSHIAELAEILKIDEILAEINKIFACQGIKCDRLILIPHRILHCCLSMLYH
ncbi:MAG: tetratricopeptide repeat protein [Richelia sp. RM2_1_2]|nr:tetratricopeptide repeat protein [Richelia sp. RM2_1_2]